MEQTEQQLDESALEAERQRRIARALEVKAMLDGEEAAALEHTERLHKRIAFFVFVPTLVAALLAAIAYEIFKHTGH